MRGAALSPDASEYVATPPLEALRVMIISAVVRPDLILDFLVFRKAHLHGLMRRRAVIRLPLETGGGFGLSWKLLYGTKDAVVTWSDCIRQILCDDMGSPVSKTSPCMFWHPQEEMSPLSAWIWFCELGVTCLLRVV